MGVFLQFGRTFHSSDVVWKMNLPSFLAGAFFSTLAVSAVAQMDPNMPMPGMSSSGSLFAQDMDTGMKKMDHDMSSAPMNGNVDHDFASMMIPHHQGAIDMAEGELKYGKDPEMRHLAQTIIVDQKKEIEFMNQWIKKHAGADAKP
jgi:uncharacterized protein (DUF305 family)